MNKLRLIKQTIYLVLLASFVSSQIYSQSWSGTSTTYGNTTYHDFRANEFLVLPAAQVRRSNDNSAAIAGAAVIGVCLGALLINAAQNAKVVHKNDFDDNFENYRPLVDHYLDGYTYEDHDRYVNSIRFSTLPDRTKKSVLDSMNYYYKKEYFSEK